MRKSALIALALVSALSWQAAARQNLVLNGSMEFGAGAGAIDPQVPANWSEFGTNVERSPTVNLAPAGGGYALKAFGDADSSSAGASQTIDGIAAGDSITATVQVYTPSFDKLDGSGSAGLVIEFLDLFGGTIDLQSVYPLDANSPADTWTPATIGPINVPGGAVDVRVTCRLRWNPGDISGAAYWDDAQITVNGGANLLLNGDFETAGNSPGQSTQGIDDWDGFNDQEKSAAYADHGSSSLQLGTREPYSGLYQFMGLLGPNEQIRMRAWALNPSTEPLQATTRVGIKLEFEADANVAPPEEVLAFDPNATVDEWHLVELETTVPDDMTVARIVMIYVGDPNETGSVYFDDAHAGATSAPGDNLLLNSGFDTGPGGVPDDWVPFGPDGAAAKDCFAVSRSGFCSLKTNGTTVSGATQEISVTPGQNLYISAYLQSAAFNPIIEPATVAGIKVEWAVGGVPADIDIGDQDNVIDDSAPLDTWIPLTINFTMPSDGAAIAQFTNLIETGTALSGYGYLDSCEAVVLNRFDGSDVNGDDLQDMIDAAWLQRTYTGAGAGMLPFNGMTFDHDDDVDVDLDDAEYFAPRMTGP